MSCFTLNHDVLTSNLPTHLKTGRTGLIKLYSPENEIELSLIKGLLEADGIPFYVHNDHFGSMYIGFQIKYFNRKMIMVPPEFEESAKELLSDFFNNQQTSPDQSIETNRKPSRWDKVRMILEAVLFFWVVPGKRGVKRKEKDKT